MSTARAFGTDGSTVGDQVQVSPADGDHFSPAVTYTETGDFVIAWDSFTSAEENSIFARHFTSANAADGTVFEVSTGADEFSPDIASAGDGSFVVSWETTDVEGSGIAAKRFDADSNPAGTLLAINSTTAGSQISPSIAVQPDGSFMVTWISGTDVVGQILASDGSTVGSESDINGSTPARSYKPSCAALNDGGFVVTWTDDDLDVLGRTFESDGTPIGTPTVLNTTTDGDQLASKMDSAANHVVATWTGPDADGRRDLRSSLYDNQRAADCRCRRSLHNRRGLARCARRLCVEYADRNNDHPLCLGLRRRWPV